MKRIKIGLVGDFHEKIHTLVALNKSIEHCRVHLSFSLDAQWIHTEEIEKMLPGLENFHGLWIVPGSPYKNDEGVYEIIRLAREKDLPILGSCGGFQYMLLEYAKNVLMISGAGHEENEPESNHVISKLTCSLKGKQEEIFIRDKNSWLFNILKTDKIVGKYYCSYGVNPIYLERLNQFPMVFTAFSPEGDVRAFELKTHRFFNGTLFQPSLDSTKENPSPLILNFFKACESDPLSVIR